MEKTARSCTEEKSPPTQESELKTLKPPKVHHKNKKKESKTLRTQKSTTSIEQQPNGSGTKSVSNTPDKQKLSISPAPTPTKASVPRSPAKRPKKRLIPLVPLEKLPQPDLTKDTQKVVYRADPYADLYFKWWCLNVNRCLFISILHVLLLISKCILEYKQQSYTWLAVTIVFYILNLISCAAIYQRSSCLITFGILYSVLSCIILMFILLKCNNVYYGGVATFSIPFEDNKNSYLLLYVICIYIDIFFTTIYGILGMLALVETKAIKKRKQEIEAELKLKTRILFIGSPEDVNEPESEERPVSAPKPPSVLGFTVCTSIVIAMVLHVSLEVPIIMWSIQSENWWSLGFHCLHLTIHISCLLATKFNVLPLFYVVLLLQLLFEGFWVPQFSIFIVFYHITNSGLEDLILRIHPIGTSQQNLLGYLICVTVLILVILYSSMIIWEVTNQEYIKKYGERKKRKQSKERTQ